MMTAKELANRLGYTCSGYAENEIAGIGYASCCEEDYLAVVLSGDELNDCMARTLLSDKPLLVFGKSVIVSSDNIDLAIIKTANLLVESGICKDYRIRSELGSAGNYLTGKNTYIGDGTTIGAFAVIESGTVIGDNCRIGSNVFIGADTVIGNNTVVGSGTRISTESIFHGFDGKYIHFAGVGKVVIGNNAFIGSNSVIQRGTLSDTLINDGCVIGDLVDIGHDCVIGSDCRIVSQCGISGNVHIGEKTVIYGQSGVANFVKLGKNVTVMGRTAVTKSVEDGVTVSGAFGRDHYKELRFNASLRKIVNERI